jgi:nicotinamidase-related amidase
VTSGDIMTNRKSVVSIHDDPPILVCADLQTEYLTEGRRHVIADADAITSRCLELLTLWRNNLWPIIHLKRIAQAAWFNPASNLTNWIADLKPRPGELAFEHPLPSAYSSTRFAEYMANMRNIRCVLSGFSLDETILSTVVDGFHRSHRYQIVSDAVACRRLGTGDPASYKMAVIKVIGNFAGVVESADLMEADAAIAV